MTHTQSSHRFPISLVSTDPLIYLRNISLHFGARTLFEGLNLAFRPGEKVGLIGRNGSGKSTLLQILSGQLRPDTGSVEMPAGAHVGYLSQTVHLNLDLTPVQVCTQAFDEIGVVDARIQDILYQLEQTQDTELQLTLSEELSALYERHALLGAAHQPGEIERVLRGMGFTHENIHFPLHTFSGGWRMRVELSRLLLTQPDILLLDEPTNHLDIESILWFEKYLSTYESTVIIVSHDQHFLDHVTHRTLEIEYEDIDDYPYPYRQAMEKKVEMREILESAYRNQQRQIAHKERLIDKFRAKASKAKFAKALQTELERMIPVEFEDGSDKSIKLSFAAGIRPGRVVYRTVGLNKSYGEKTVIRNLDLTIERGARIAFIGQNGQGKTTLARMLAGVLTHDSGELEPGHNVSCGYYAQDQPDRIDTQRTVVEVLRDAAPAETEGRLRNILGALLFSGDDVDKKCSVLSGGERARLAFACMMMTPSNVLILDEPTNHLDIQSKEILQQALLRYEGTLIVVSHDLHFLTGLTTTTLEFADGQIRYLLYDITEYLERREMEDLRMLEMQSTVPVVREKPVVIEEVPQKPGPGSKKRQELQKKIQSLEKTIGKLEEQKRVLEDEMAMTDFYFRADVQERTTLYEETTKSLENKTAEWEKLVTEFEA